MAIICPNEWAIAENIDVNNKDALNLSRMMMTIADKMTPLVEIQNAIPKIVPFIKLLIKILSIKTKANSLIPKSLIVIKEIILAKPKRMPKVNGGINKFSTTLMITANADSNVK